MGSPWINGKFTFDLSENLIFAKDEQNYIDALGIQQLNTIGNIYFLDIFLSKDNYVDLHYHSNASELTYCISGAVEISFINPTPNEWQRFVLTPGDAVSIPQGFWHCAKALEDDTHILATHDTNNLQTIFGSDVLRLTPDEVMANIYCLDEAELANVLAPMDETIVIGPPTSCERETGGVSEVPEEEGHMPMFPNGGVGDEAESGSVNHSKNEQLESHEQRKQSGKIGEKKLQDKGSESATLHRQIEGKAQRKAEVQIPWDQSLQEKQRLGVVGSRNIAAELDVSELSDVAAEATVSEPNNVGVEIVVNEEGNPAVETTTSIPIKSIPESGTDKPTAPAREDVSNERRRFPLEIVNNHRNTIPPDNTERKGNDQDVVNATEQDNQEDEGKLIPIPRFNEVVYTCPICKQEGDHN